MRASVLARDVARQSKSVDGSLKPSSTLVDGEPGGLSTPVDNSAPAPPRDEATLLALLRTCVQDRGWTLEALERFMGKGFDKSLISRVLNGERPLTLKFVVALPDDIEALYAQRRAEAFGLIVVEPVYGDAAVKSLVSGLVGVLSQRLPVRAGRMAKATVASIRKAVAR